MSFITLRYLFWLAAVCALFYCLPKRVQWVWLLVVNYCFYLMGGAQYLLYLLITTVSTYAAALLISGSAARQKQRAALLSGAAERKALGKRMRGQRKLMVAAVLLVNFGILCFLKYYNFAAQNLNLLLLWSPLEIALPYHRLLLPLGISFYTFQSAGYVIDVYRNKYPANRNLAQYALFVSFFPQLGMGPIGRYNDLGALLPAPKSPSYRNITFGAQRIVWGLFKKLVISERLAVLVNHVYGGWTAYTGLTFAVTAVAYAIQLYTDFSGYIDIAAGSAQLFGIPLAENFERPYFSKNIAEYWRRWHITLGTWFKDYLFYPISISKFCGKLSKLAAKVLPRGFARTIPAAFSLMVVWLVNGVWHGAAWHYIFTGVYYGAIIIASMWLEPVFAKIVERFHFQTESFSWKLFRVLRTFALVCIGDIFFRAPSLRQAFHILWRMAADFNPWIFTDGTLLTLGLDGKELFVAVAASLILLSVSLIQRGGSVREKIAAQSLPLRWFIYLAAVFSVILFGYYGPGVSTSEFIYMQF